MDYRGERPESRHTALAIVRAVSSKDAITLPPCSYSESHPRAGFPHCLCPGPVPGERGLAGVLQSHTLTLVKDFIQPELRLLKFPHYPPILALVSVREAGAVCISPHSIHLTEDYPDRKQVFKQQQQHITKTRKTITARWCKQLPWIIPGSHSRNPLKQIPLP